MSDNENEPAGDGEMKPPMLGLTRNILDMKLEEQDMRTDRASVQMAPFVAELPQILANMRAMLPQLAEYYAEKAKQQKAKFDALLAAGFSEAQAIKLCKDDGL